MSKHICGSNGFRDVEGASCPACVKEERLCELGKNVVIDDEELIGAIEGLEIWCSECNRTMNLSGYDIVKILDIIHYQGYSKTM